MRRRLLASLLLGACVSSGCGGPTVLGDPPISAPRTVAPTSDAGFTLTTGTLPAVDERSIALPTVSRPTVPTSAVATTVAVVPTTTEAPAPPCAAFTLQGPLFDADSAALAPGADAALQDLVTALRAHESGQLVISGHTDERPTDYAGGNQGLSEARATAVGARLRLLGLPSPIEMTTVGYGADRPVDASGTPEAFARNRRVEFVLACG